MSAYTFWLFGLPSSGKTTLASSVYEEFNLTHLDSDKIRIFLTPNPVFTQNEREFVYRSIIHSCYLLNENGIDVIVSATANLNKYRILAKDILNNLKMIYTECSIEICEKRDLKGLYKNSRNGLLSTVPIRIEGQNDEYINQYYKNVDVFDFPTEIDFSINTSILKIEESTNILREYIKSVLNIND